MEKGLAIRRRLHSFLYKNLFRIVSALFVFTMVSVWLTCGLFAKYATSDSGSDFATVAKIGGIEVYEHEAVYNATNGEYTLENNSRVVSNNYDKVVPGTKIKKDPTIVIDGSSDVACEVYLEVVDSSNGELTYDLSDWTEVVGVKGIHEGKLYKYKDAISVHKAETISIIKDEYISVSSNISTDSTFSLDFYAYLVQLD